MHDRYSQQDRKLGTAIIERKCSDSTKNRRRIYHVSKHVARGLARSENRDLSEAEEASRFFTTSEIVLAFPVKDSVPIVEPKEVHAFLSVKKKGVSMRVSISCISRASQILMPTQFLIQADFVTQANRQDVVMTSQRNEGLIEAIADAFVASVLKFCQHPNLQYKWIRYLPLEDTCPWDGLWKDLVSSIRSKIESLTVFRSPERSTRRTVNDLCYLQEGDKDRHGTPLLADLRPEVYLPYKYDPADVAILKKFGLTSLSFRKRSRR